MAARKRLGRRGRWFWSAWLIAGILAASAVLTAVPSGTKEPQPLSRVAWIEVRHPGLPIARIEKLITNRIEEAVTDVPGVAAIDSSTSTGTAAVVVTVDKDYRNLEKFWRHLRGAIAGVKAKLPAGSVGPIVRPAPKAKR